jgi:prepilin-type N-terminal cleavage/methylation domain-containing protein
MQFTKSNTSLKAGFSLVEMLVVIAIIGIIAAIAIPNIGNLNDSARDTAAKRNAQTVASVLNAAIAAGASHTFSSSTTAAAVIDAAEAGISPTDGAFKGKAFTSGPIDDDEGAKTSSYLSWVNDNGYVEYNGS